MLIRPDGHVAARGRPGSLEPVAGYLRDLFREPAGHPGAQPAHQADAAGKSRVPDLAFRNRPPNGPPGSVRGMGTLRFGVVRESVADGREWLDFARRVEDSGIGTLLLRDHFSAGAFGQQLAPFSALAPRPQ